jgi:hypothetical protein
VPWKRPHPGPPRRRGGRRKRFLIPSPARADCERRGRLPLLLPPLAGRGDPVGRLPCRLIVIGVARIITIGVGGVINVVAVGIGAVINVVVVAVDGIGIIGVINNIIGAAVPEHITNHLNVPDHRQDVALRPDVAAGGALELATQDGLDGRHRLGMAILHHDGRAVGLVQRQFVEASGQRPARPSARIAGLTLLELRMPGRLAVADLVGGGCRLRGGHDGGARAVRGTGQFKDAENRRTTVIWSTLRTGLRTGRAARGQNKVYNL